MTSRGETDGSFRSSSRISDKRLRLELLARLSVPRQILKPSARSLCQAKGEVAEESVAAWTVRDVEPFRAGQEIEIGFREFV